MALPNGLDPKQIMAECKDGVLEVSIPMPAEKEAEKVQIKPRGA